MKKPNIILKIYNRSDDMVQRVVSHSIMKIYDFLAWDLKKFSYFKLRVSYSQHYKNEGEYKNKKDLIHALRAFMDRDIVKEFCK